MIFCEAIQFDNGWPAAASTCYFLKKPSDIAEGAGLLASVARCHHWRTFNRKCGDANRVMIMVD